MNLDHNVGDSLGLSPRGKPPAAAKTLYCYTPSLVATPADWPPDAVATGYWLRERTGADLVDQVLDGFVAAGAPPIYIGSVAASARIPRVLVERSETRYGGRGFVL